MAVTGAMMAGSAAMQFLGGSSGGASNMGMLSAGGSMLGSLGSFFSKGNEAKAQAAAQEAAWKERMANTREQYRQLGQQETQANKEYHEQLLQNQTSLMQKKGEVELLAGASGTGGSSITSMLSDLTGDSGRNQAQIVSNYENQMDGFVNAAKSIQSGGRMQMRSFDKPSAFSALTSGLSGAASAYTKGADIGKKFGDAWNDSRSYSSGVGL